MYIGHSNTGAEEKQNFVRVILHEPILGSKLQYYPFEENLGHVWTRSFIKTIIGVLCTEIGMSCVSDFKFIKIVIFENNIITCNMKLAAMVKLLSL